MRTDVGGQGSWFRVAGTRVRREKKKLKGGNEPSRAGKKKHQGPRTLHVRLQDGL